MSNTTKTNIPSFAPLAEQLALSTQQAEKLVFSILEALSDSISPHGLANGVSVFRLRSSVEDATDREYSDEGWETLLKFLHTNTLLLITDGEQVLSDEEIITLRGHHRLRVTTLGVEFVAAFSQCRSVSSLLNQCAQRGSASDKRIIAIHEASVRLQSKDPYKVSASMPAAPATD